jgi:hypothetical protein
LTGSNAAARAILAGRLGSRRPPEDEQVTALVREIRRRHDHSLAAILLYGSYVRGKRDTILDFYALLDTYRGAFPRSWHGWVNRILPPNVYHIRVPAPKGTVRAKYATVSMERFERAVYADFHSYFWARFAQPCTLVFVRDATTRERIVDALLDAARTFISRVLPMVPDEFDARTLWTRGFSLTYACELRSERSGYGKVLYQAYAPYLTELTDALSGAGSPGFEHINGQDYRNRCTAGARWRSAAGWRLRCLQGKILSAARLLKSAVTFNDPLDYVLWKIGRHSGVYIEPTERQRRYPLVFAWGLLWRVYRRGGFR